MSWVTQSTNRYGEISGVMDTMRQYKTMFPGLLEYSNFKNMLSTGSLELAATEFKNNHGDNGLRALTEFEELMKSYPDINVSSYEVEQAYVAGKKYYQQKK